ncbi:MAG: anaerobic ribonucleoside-triphosphate reductase activating protein [Clostridia bacterium]|nr:anaerobic ribonucleoside-triphosphate reductase activating protein [Clostridia bacterium]
MRICGLIKTTLLDFPGKVACTVFLGGCNLRCPFCHNSEIAFSKKGDEVSEEEFFSFLAKRKSLLEGVCVTGGEPLTTDEIFDFLRKIKDMGFCVKIDTNGCFPERLQKVIESGYIDFVAMDIKNSLSKYEKTVGIENFDVTVIQKSIEIIKSSNIDYEFRTTVVKGLHTEADIEDLARIIPGENNYFLQGFKMSDRVPDKTLEEFTQREMKRMLNRIKTYVPDSQLRGV